MDTGTSTSILPFGDDYEITDGVVTKYISAPGLGVIAKKVGTDTFWIHTDRQGSVNVVSDAAGLQVLRRTYRPYGEKQSEDGSHVESRGYIDQRTDAASGLTYLHARYYDARVGVFVSPDPMQPASAGVGVNRYAYVAGQPGFGTDRSGLDGEDPGCTVTWDPKRSRRRGSTKRDVPDGPTRTSPHTEGCPPLIPQNMTGYEQYTYDRVLDKIFQTVNKPHKDKRPEDPPARGAATV